MQIPVEKYHSVRQLGYPFWAKPQIGDRDGRADISFRRISVGYEDQSHIIKEVTNTSTTDSFLLMQPGFVITLVHPTLSSLGIVLRAPKEEDSSQDPVVAAVRLKEIIPGVEIMEDVDSTRLRQGEFVAVGIADGKGQSFTIDFVLTRRKGEKGTALTTPTLNAPAAV